MIINKIFGESINIYKITFYAINSILIRVTGYLLILSFLIKILLITTTILDNINLIYILFFLMSFIIILLILHFYTGFCKNICTNIDFLDLNNKYYILFIKIHILLFYILTGFFYFLLISLNYINNLSFDLIYTYYK